MLARPDGVARNWMAAGFSGKGEEKGWIEDPSPLATQLRHLLCRGKLPGQDDDFWLSKHVEMAKIELGNRSFSSVLARGMKRGTIRSPLLISGTMLFGSVPPRAGR